METEEDKIDKALMEAGYLCPDYRLHIFGKLSEWENDVKYMTCENCGEKKVAMALIPNLLKD